MWFEPRLAWLQSLLWQLRSDDNLPSAQVLISAPSQIHLQMYLLPQAHLLPCCEDQASFMEWLLCVRMFYTHFHTESSLSTLCPSITIPISQKISWGTDVWWLLKVIQSKVRWQNQDSNPGGLASKQGLSEKNRDPWRTASLSRPVPSPVTPYLFRLWATAPPSLPNATIPLGLDAFHTLSLGLQHFSQPPAA